MPTYVATWKKRVAFVSGSRTYQRRVYVEAASIDRALADATHQQPAFPLSRIPRTGETYACITSIALAPGQPEPY